MKYIEVYLEDYFLFQNRLTYKTSLSNIEVGMRVYVPLRNRKRVAFIVEIKEPYATDYVVQPILSPLDESPVLNKELLALGEKMAYYYLAPTISCYQTILPNQLRPKTNHQKVKNVRMVELVDPRADQKRLSPNQMDFLKKINQTKVMTYQEAREIYSGIQTLIKRGFVSEFYQERSYKENQVKNKSTPLELTSDQKQVLSSISTDTFETYLLHGVTGSGKTEIFLQLAERIINKGKQVLILVPEISLTPQMIERVSSRFLEDVAIYHSGLNNQEKYEQYKRVKNNEVQFIVGTRSAVFLPFNHLGLIVMDEEHDSSYKQESTPYYHTRDIALWRAEHHDCPLVLASASPSLESYARALKNVYRLLELPSRINENFPEVELVDTRQSLYRQESPYLSKHLLQRIKETLEREEQVIILLNRRGYLPILKDAKTGNILYCPSCDVALNYHKKENILRCHVCSYQTKQAPEGLELVGSGVGTERLTEQLKKIFPHSSIARMDADTTRKKGTHEKILGAFSKHEYDMLIGTQMIAKGLDIENVTLVGIINADSALTHQDYRSVENTFSILLQASGRSGRGSKKGRVVIQSFNPEHYAIVCAVHQKYKHFFQEEMKYRKVANYPPYTYLISFVFSDKKEEKSLEAAHLFASFIDHVAIQIIGPAPIRRLSNRYRTRIIMKGRDLTEMIEYSHKIIDLYQSISRTTLTVDVNPLSIE